MANNKRCHYAPEELAEMAKEDELRRLNDERYEEEQAAIRAALHPAFKRVAERVIERQNAELHTWDVVDYAVTNDECVQFLLDQIALIKQLHPGNAVVLAELQAIADDLQQRGGDAYQEHLRRLQALTRRVAS